MERTRQAYEYHEQGYSCAQAVACTFADVVDGVTQKMVFRHPHVFGSVQAENTDQALDTWDAQKREEKDQRTAGDTLDAVARSLPALIRAEKIQNKAAKAGFDWPEAGPALEKVAEVGDTGEVTGAHLHFELKVNGELVDPADYIETE